MITVGIVEDNQTVRETLRDWVDSAAGYRCVCVCTTVKEAMVEIPRYRPAVVLMDIHLPAESGISCTARLKEQLPDVQVIIVTVYNDHDLIFEALKAGASGYLLKRSSQSEILNAIAEVQSGGSPMTGEIARRVVETFQQPGSIHRGEEMEVSPREMDVLRLLAKGLTNKAIASGLGISLGTVNVHVSRIYKKLHVRSRTAAAVKLMAHKT